MFNQTYFARGSLTFINFALVPMFSQVLFGAGSCVCFRPCRLVHAYVLFVQLDRLGRRHTALPGEYILTATQSGASATGKASIKSAPILPIYSKPKRVLQGDPLRLSCKVSAWPLPPKVDWSFHHIDVAQSDDKTAINDAFVHLKPLDIDSLQWENVKFAAEDGVQSDTLRFAELDPKHNGLYACKVSNGLGNDVTFLLVDVKDRWAALWPFIGIVIEVTVLVAAILLYERHQMRSKTSTANNANVDSASPNGAASGGTERTSRTEEVRLRTAARA
ncbi:hypothetical protein SprV_0200695000 [Sparganum proliferum]